MFHTFFPKPKLFFGSFALWAVLCVAAWFWGVRELAGDHSLGSLFGYGLPAELADGDLETAQAAFKLQRNAALTFWSYQYMLVCYAAFAGFWLWYAPHRWSKWSVAGSAVIIFITWIQVQMDVMINQWFGRFYDTVQKALSGAGKVTEAAFYEHLATFTTIALIGVTLSVISNFLISHYVFRWRTAMNDFYMANWDRLRHIEGASQRVQEDTKRFATIGETLGVKLIDSVMTLAAFLPILWGLSAHVTKLPLVGEVSQGLVFVAIVWSIGGTVLLAVAGVRLPGLEFRNQRVEAAYRKELVLGEDRADRAKPPTVRELFGDVRRNYFTLYLNYMYFNIVRYAYLQAGVLVPYVALAPTIVSGTITLGIMQQIIRAFNRVENSFQFLVNSWTTIVELLSIYKRLAAFSATLEGQHLSPIEDEPRHEPSAQLPNAKTA
jgi:peptide/bleomycin uptake transporter